MQQALVCFALSRGRWPPGLLRRGYRVCPSLATCTWQSDEALFPRGLGGMPNLAGTRPDDCGYSNIGVGPCWRRGCVWKPQKEQGSPWCRYPSPDD